MKHVLTCLTAAFVLFRTGLSAQEEKTEREPGHYNTNKFKQLYEEFATPIKNPIDPL